MSLEPTLEDLLKLVPDKNERENYRKELSNAHVPSSLEIEAELKKPGSSIQNIVIAAISRFISNENFIKETNKLINKLKLLSDSLFRPNSPKPQAITEDDKSTINDLTNRLNETVQERHLLNKDLMSDLILEARAQRTREVSDFTAHLAREGIILQPAHTALLNSGPTGPELVQRYPERAQDPGSALQLLRQGDLMTELLARKVATSVQHGTPLDETNTLDKPNAQFQKAYTASFQSAQPTTPALRYERRAQKQHENPNEEKQARSRFPQTERNLAHEFLVDMVIAKKLENGINDILSNRSTEAEQAIKIRHLIHDVEDLRRNLIEKFQSGRAAPTPLSMRNTPFK